MLSLTGHTHIAQGEWIDGVFVGNCGTWAPAYRDVACTTPVEDGKPFVWLRSDGEAMSGGLMRWRDGDVMSAEQAPMVRQPVVSVGNGGGGGVEITLKPAVFARSAVIGIGRL